MCLFVLLDLQVRDGWWDGEYIDLIRQILKRKFFALLNEGIKLPDEAFNDLLEQLEAYRSQKRQHIDETVHEWDHMMETGGEGEYESMGQEGQHAPTALRKLISLKDKGKRSQKPKAKVIDDSLASPHHPVNAPAKSVADSRYIKRASALDQL